MSALPPIEEKAAYVEQMFGRVAKRYDRINAAMTFGLDSNWRRHAVDLVVSAHARHALDVGTGTGDFLPLLAARGLHAVGADFSIPMMRAGRPKIEPLGESGAFVAGDALHLPFHTASFDAITTGFALRNVVDINQALREMWRVARPGGAMVCVEVARPGSELLRFGHRIYFERIVPRIAQLLGGDVRAYTYLPQSARAFPPPEQLAAMMRMAGWTNVSYQLVGMGAAAIHYGRKEPEKTHGALSG